MRKFIDLYSEDKLPTSLEIEEFSNEYDNAGLRFYDNEVSRYFIDRNKKGADSFVDFRQEYLEEYGFVILNVELISELTKFLKGKSVLDVASGSGYLAHFLNREGCEVTSVDDGTWDKRFNKIYHRSEVCDAVKFIESNKFDVYILSWPVYANPFGFNIAKLIPDGAILIYQGEGAGGCTGDDNFHNYLDTHFTLDKRKTASINEHHYSFATICDYWYWMTKDKK